MTDMKLHIIYNYLNSDTLFFHILKAHIVCHQKMINVSKKVFFMCYFNSKTSPYDIIEKPPMWGSVPPVLKLKMKKLSYMSAWKRIPCPSVARTDILVYINQKHRNTHKYT